MSHDAIETNSKPEVAKTSLLQALAVKEIEETHSLGQAQAKAELLVQDAKKDAQSQLDHLPNKLSELENEILKRESELGTKEALEIQIESEKQLADNILVWQKRVDQTAENLIKRILKVEA